MATVTFDHVTKRFGPEATAVDDLNLEVATASSWSWSVRRAAGRPPPPALCGRPGDHQRGAAADRRVVNDVVPKDRDIAMVFQSYALYRSTKTWPSD